VQGWTPPSPPLPAPPWSAARPALRQKRSGRRIRLSTRPAASSELPQEPQVIFEVEAQIGDAVLNHMYALDTQAECKAGPALGVDAIGFQDIGMHETRAAKLQPPIVPVDRIVDSGLDEREEVGP